MNVEIGTEAEKFLFRKYINPKFFAVCMIGGINLCRKVEFVENLCPWYIRYPPSYYDNLWTLFQYLSHMTTAMWKNRELAHKYFLFSFQLVTEGFELHMFVDITPIPDSQA